MKAQTAAGIGEEASVTNTTHAGGNNNNNNNNKGNYTYSKEKICVHMQHIYVQLILLCTVYYCCNTV